MNINRGFRQRRTLFLLSAAFILLPFQSYALYKLYKGNDIELSNNAILCMYQDKEGYMWFGTYDGLNLYNSRTIAIYRSDMHSKQALCSNIIHRITEAEPGYLWISTFLGLNKFDLKKRIVTESYPEYPEAKLIASDASGNTCLLTQNEKLTYYSATTHSFTTVPMKGISPDQIKALYAGTKDHFYLLNQQGEMMELSFAMGSGQTPSFRVSRHLIHDKPLSAAFYSDNTLYFIDQTDDLYRYSQNGQKQYVTNLGDAIKKYGVISQIISFRQDLFLAFKSSGLLQLNHKESFRPETITLNVGVFSLLKDRLQDILWVGTDGQGAKMYYNKHEQFGSLTFSQLPASPFKPVRAILTDENKDLWIGTKGGGIMRIREYDREQEQTIPRSHITTFTTKDGLSNDQVFCFLKSNYNDGIWIGTEGPGLSFFSRKKEQVITLQGSANQLIQKVHSIEEINDSSLWVATAGNGLLKVTVKRQGDSFIIRSVQSFSFEKNGKNCREFHSMLYDGDSTLLIGSRGGYGVIRFNIYTHQYSFFSTNQQEYSAIGDVLSVYLSADSTLYFGASSGLTSLSLSAQETNRIEQFDRKDGMANDMIHGILEDGNHCLFLSTNKGLTKYNPQNNFFHNYFHDLKVTEFSDDAYWKCPYTHRLFFGGVNGLVWVDPKEERSDTFAPALSFFNLTLSGADVPLSDYMDTVRKQLVIPADVHSFSVSFVAVDYINGENYEYSYLLEGHNKEWVRLQKTNEIAFTNLSAGKYILKVKYKNDVFDSEANAYSLPIRILPPWYLSNEILFVYVILCILLAFYIFRKIKKRIVHEQQALAAKIREEQREKMLEVKLDFFTNITHEICTPLTLINGVSEQIEAFTGGNEQLKKYIQVLHNNVSSLNELIQEILTFRKIEGSEFNLQQIKRVSVSDLVYKSYVSFKPLAERNEIDYRLSVPAPLIWNTDPAIFKKILTNLLSNAFKYTNPKGRIEVILVQSDEALRLTVYNTGQGIAQEKISSIFNRFEILETGEENTMAETISRHGLGLSICNSLVNLLKGKIEVRSELNQFAEFTVYLPYQESHEPEEKHEEEVAVSKEIAALEAYFGKTSEKAVILVVDDNQDIVWLITQTLSKHYTVIQAQNVEEAKQILEQQTPALIVTDIIMPGTDGLAFTSFLKSNKYTKQIPVVIISAKITEAEQAKGFEVGADAYLTKPFSSQLLQAVVNRLVVNKGELKEYYYSSESAFEKTGGQLMHLEDKEFLDSVLSILENNLDRDALRPEFIAEKLGMNVRSLYRRFKKITSLSPSDFIKDYRLKYAAKLLLTTQLTVQEIIYKTGISNKSYFYREFTKKYHMTPKDYRCQPSR